MLMWIVAVLIVASLAVWAWSPEIFCQYVKAAWSYAAPKLVDAVAWVGAKAVAAWRLVSQKFWSILAPGGDDENF